MSTGQILKHILQRPALPDQGIPVFFDARTSMSLPIARLEERHCRKDIAFSLRSRDVAYLR